MNRTFERDRGFVTFAQNGQHDYLKMAYALALSIKATQSNYGHLSVFITPGMTIPGKYKEVFDHVIDIPWGDEAEWADWKLQNEWKAYHITPYRETIKLDADMLFTSDVSSWWDYMAVQDVCMTTNTKTYRNEDITSDFYRKAFVANNLPNVYTAFMYFKYSDLAQEVYQLAENLFHYWNELSFKYLDDAETRPDQPSTDIVFAMAAKMVGERLCTVSNGVAPSFVHMRSKAQKWPLKGYTEIWTDHVPVGLTDDLQLKIGRHRQTLPFHYHIKSFLTDDVIKTYEKALGI